jgi:hypothetical protein
MIHIIRSRATKEQMEENRSMEVLDPSLRERIAQIVQDLLGGV